MNNLADNQKFKTEDAYRIEIYFVDTNTSLLEILKEYMLSQMEYPLVKILFKMKKATVTSVLQVTVAFAFGIYESNSSMFTFLPK